MLNAFLVALAVFICVGGAELIGFTMLNRPIVIGPLVGLFLGDLHTGVIIGASLEAVFMGVVNIGGASAAEPGIATAVGTAFAIMLGKGSEVALTLALPIGILGLQIKTVLYIFIVGMFAKTFDRLAAEGKEKQIIALHYGLWAVNWFLYSLFAFFGILFGSDAVSALLDAIPDVVMNGLTVCGGLLPAVGLIMVGGMTASMVTFNSTYELTMKGESVLNLQNMLDQIFIGIVPLGLTLLCYYLLKKKNVSITVLIIGVIILSILLSLLGIA